MAHKFILYDLYFLILVLGLGVMDPILFSQFTQGQPPFTWSCLCRNWSQPAFKNTCHNNWSLKHRLIKLCLRSHRCLERILFPWKKLVLFQWTFLFTCIASCHWAAPVKEKCQSINIWTDRNDTLCQKLKLYCNSWHYHQWWRAIWGIEICFNAENAQKQKHWMLSHKAKHHIRKQWDGFPTIPVIQSRWDVRMKYPASYTYSRIDFILFFMYSSFTIQICGETKCIQKIFSFIIEFLGHLFMKTYILVIQSLCGHYRNTYTNSNSIA